MASPLFKDTEPAWYPLDNTALIMASANSRSSTFLYRITCTFRNPVRLPALKDAIAAVMPRFPLFMVELRPGFFWYYLEPLDRIPDVVTDSRCPQEFLDIHRKGRHLFRIRAYKNRLSCEFHHILTDGTGSVTFMRSLVAEYLIKTGIHVPDTLDILRPGEKPDPEESEDAYAKLLDKSIPEPKPEKDAFHLPGTLLDHNHYRITTGIMNLGETLKRAKGMGLTLTEYLVSAYFMALQEVYRSESTHEKSRRGKVLAVLVPVSLRKFYPSKTLRNFFLTVNVQIDPAEGKRTFAEFGAIVSEIMRERSAEEHFKRQLRRNVGGEVRFDARILPLFVKDILLSVIFRALSDKPLSGSLSNMGPVTMPAGFSDHIARFDLIPSRSRGTVANMGVISYNDVLSVSIGSLAADNTLERVFFRTLVDDSLKVGIECNM